MVDIYGEIVVRKSKNTQTDGNRLVESFTQLIWYMDPVGVILAALNKVER